MTHHRRAQRMLDFRRRATGSWANRDQRLRHASARRSCRRGAGARLEGAIIFLRCTKTRPMLSTLSQVGHECTHDALRVRSSPQARQRPAGSRLAIAGTAMRGRLTPSIACRLLDFRHAFERSRRRRCRPPGDTASVSWSMRADAEAATLDQPGERAGAPGDQAAVAARGTDAVVRHEPGERARRAAPRSISRRARRRFARAGGAADQHARRRRPATQPHARVGPAQARGRRAGGRRSARPATSSPLRRFSARIRPPWASTICLEIDRPRPEFWPKPWSSGRSV